MNMPIPRVRVVTDSTSDIPEDIARQLDITVVPANIQFADRSFQDGVDLSRDEFYRRLVSGTDLPTTSAPAAGIFAQTYRGVAARSAAAGQPLEGVVAVHLASRLSGLFNAARLGAEDVTETQVHLVDSQQVSIGTGLLAIVAARAAQAGMGLHEIVELVEARVPRVRLLALLDTLDYVRRSGRLGPARWLLGTLLNIKPIIAVRHGEVLPPVELARTRGQGLQRLTELATELAPFEELAVVHAQTPQLAATLLDRLSLLHPRDQIICSEVGVTIGTYAGPGAVGFICVQRAD
jgi:DegV family protein with EDD domain